MLERVQLLERKVWTCAARFKEWIPLKRPIKDFPEVPFRSKTCTSFTFVLNVR